MHPHQRPFLALGLRLLAMALLSIMLLLVKVGGAHGLALPETMFWRQLVPSIAIAAWLGLRGQAARLRTYRPWLHARRAVTGTVGMFLTMGVVLLLPLAEATILGFTSPMFAVILATIFLREHVDVWRWSAVVLGLAGVAVIAGPDRGHMPLLGLTVGLGAAFFVALVSIQLRDLGRTEEPIRIVFWFSAIGAVMLAPAAMWTGRAHSSTEWAILLATGLAGLFAQLCMTAALRFGSVAAVVTMDYSQLVWATLWGWLVFSQLPPASSWIGGPLIVAAGLLIAWRERVLHRRPVIDPETAPGAD